MSVPVIGGCLYVVFAITFLILELQYWCEDDLLRFVPKILLALSIPVLNKIYAKIAIWLNDMGK